MIVVDRAPPYLTVQDMGRPGYRASGVPAGGAMDQWSLAVANGHVGNASGAAVLEWAIAGGSLVFDEDTEIAMAGADIEASLDGKPVVTRSRISVRAGQALHIERLLKRRFLYVAVSGGIESPLVLGSRGTYLPASLGGVEGRRLKSGDQVLTGKSRSGVGIRNLTSAGLDEEPDYDSPEVRVIPGRAQDLFDEVAAMEYAVSAASDRMGYRMEGTRALGANGASITSEPVCAGAMQLPPEGQPIVLMADSPTVGGYRVAGTVISCDLPILAQCMPGRRVRFVGVSVAVAQEALRRREKALSPME